MLVSLDNFCITRQFRAADGTASGLGGATFGPAGTGASTLSVKLAHAFSTFTDGSGKTVNDIGRFVGPPGSTEAKAAIATQNPHFLFLPTGHEKYPGGPRLYCAGDLLEILYAMQNSGFPEPIPEFYTTLEELFVAIDNESRELERSNSAAGPNLVSAAVSDLNSFEGKAFGELLLQMYACGSTLRYIAGPHFVSNPTGGFMTIVNDILPADGGRLDWDSLQNTSTGKKFRRECEIHLDYTVANFGRAAFMYFHKAIDVSIALQSALLDREIGKKTQHVAKASGDLDVASHGLLLDNELLKRVKEELAINLVELVEFWIANFEKLSLKDKLSVMQLTGRNGDFCRDQNYSMSGFMGELSARALKGNEQINAVYVELFKDVLG